MSNYELYAKIGGDSSGLQRALNNARKSVGLTRANMQKLAVAGVAGFKALAAGGAAAGAALTLLTRSGLQLVDSQAKLARSFGSSIDSLTAMQLAAEDAGLEGLDMSLARLNRRLGAAEQGIGEYKRSMDALNLSAAELQELPIDERVAVIADAMRDAGISMQETARHAQTLGFEQANATDFFLQGGDAIRRARREVDEYGLSISMLDAAQVEEANDQFERVGRVMRVIKQELAIIVAGPMAVFSQRLIDAGKNAGGFRNIIEPALVMMARLFAKAADMIQGMRIAYNLFGSVVLEVGATIIRVQNMITGALTATVSAATTGLLSLIELANNVPGVNIPTDGIEAFKNSVDGVVPMFERMADSFERQALNMASAGQRLLGDALPSEMLDQFLADVAEWRANFEAEFEAAASNAKTSIEDKVGGGLETISKFAEQAGANIQTAFADFLFNPFEEGLKGMLRSFIQVINRMVAEIIASQLLTAFFSQFAGQSGILGSMASGMGIQAAPASHTGTLATGGPMMARQPYIVGEKGPEMVVPSKSSYVIPNNKLGNGGGTTLNVTVNAEDPGAEGRIRTMIEREMAPQIIEAATGRTLNRLSRPQFA